MQGFRKKLVRHELVEYLESNGLLRGTQHGFRKGRSCLTNLLISLDRVTEELDNGRSIDVDFAKAFDNVPHRRLIRKLERYGVPGRFFFNTIFVSSHMYPENPGGTQVIVGSMNMGYISETVRNRTHNLFRLKREPIPLYHSDGRTEGC